MSTYVDRALVGQEVEAPPGVEGARVLHASGVAAGYGSTKIVEAVDLQVMSRQVVLIVGPNGAGKSTLLKVVMGELPCLAGRVEILGRETTGWSTAEPPVSAWDTFRKMMTCSCRSPFVRIFSSVGTCSSRRSGRHASMW